MFPLRILFLVVLIITTTITCVTAQTLTLSHFRVSNSCNGTAHSVTSYGVDSCIFGAEGKTSARYNCNATHAIMRVYTQATDCTGRFFLTEPKLGECLKVISTSLKFTCSAGNVVVFGVVMNLVLVVLMTIL